jgi:undecaprenyl phosphate N,N'-diacetylbacillosamine 1-phosphate transferase
VFDVGVALLVLVLALWLIVLIALCYWISFSFPVFFSQERIGKDEKVIRILKFRTLRSGDGDADERRFLLGDILRFTSLDELPQVINILKGEMSVVGPRPLPVEYLPLYTEQQRKRHDVLPGVTGWAQVNGRHSIPWDKKFFYDLYYVEHVSFMLDLKIIIKTVALILSFKKDVSLEEERLK